MKRTLLYIAVLTALVAAALLIRHYGSHPVSSPSSSSSSSSTSSVHAAGTDKGPASDADFPSLPSTAASSDTSSPPDRDATRPLIVTVRGDGVPLENAQVLAELGVKRGHRILADTDSNGYARMAIPARTDALAVGAGAGRFAAVSFMTNGIECAITPLEIAINLTEQGVVITAEIRADRPFAPRNLAARIVSKTEDSRWLRAVFATNCADNHIVFPAIRTGLSNLVVSVRGDDMAACFSDPFDTLDCSDKTVVVEVPDMLTMSGHALLDTGGPAQIFDLVAKPVGRQDGEFKVGVFKGAVTTDAQGAYEVSPLVSALYMLRAACSGCYDLETNVWFVDGATPVDLVFTTIKYVKCNGTVVMADTELPVSGVKVAMTTWLRQKNAKTETGGDGTFSFDVPVNPNGPFAALRADKDGYVPAVAFLDKDYAGEPVTLRLRQAGVLAGTVRDELHQPVVGIAVSARPGKQLSREITSPLPSNERSFSPPPAQRKTVQYGMSYLSAPTDGEGQYLISNVAAPETYVLDVQSEQYFVPRSPGAPAPIVQAEPQHTVYCDLTVREMSMILVRAIDQDNEPITDYSLHVELAGGSTRDRFDQRVKLDGDTWFHLPLKGRALYPDTLVSLQAFRNELVSDKTNNLPLCGPPTNFVTLVLTPQEPLATGYVLMPDDTPAPKAIVEATAMRTFTNTRVVSDQSGYFAVFGLETEDNTERIALRVRAKWGEYADAATNVLVHSQNVVIRLNPLLTLKGVVHYEVRGIPATNFSIRIDPGSLRRGFRPDDGAFTWFLSAASAPRKGALFITAPGYAPVEQPFAFPAASNVCDMGDIVLGAQDCTLKGKVVTHERRPLAADVVVRKIGDGVQWQLGTRSSAADGSFTFSSLPVCNVKVTARTCADSAESELTTLLPSDTVFLPDLVIFTTNAQEVTFIFTLADGTPGARLYIEQFREFTDASGMMTAWVKPGTYARVAAYKAWTIRSDGTILPNRTGAMIYYADPFEIVADVHSIHVTLQPGDHIGGMATINGRPVDDTLQFTHPARQVTLNVVVSAGVFAFDGPEGYYVVTYRNRHTAVAVTLTKNAENQVQLESGTSALNVQFPWRGTWALDARLNVGNYWTTVANVQQQDGSVGAITELPAGQYRLFARGRQGAAATNMVVTVTLGEAERKSIGL